MFGEICNRSCSGWRIAHDSQVKAEIAHATLKPTKAEVEAFVDQAAYFDGYQFISFAGNFHTASIHALNASDVHRQTPPLPATWLAPVAAFWQSLLQRLQDPDLSDDAALATAQESIQRLPELITDMDVDALAELFEAAMGQAAVISMRDRLRRRALISPGDATLTALSATGPTVEGVAFAPMLEAVDKLERKAAITSKLSSAQWQRVPLELRERAFFSARVESARFLSVAQRKLQQRLKLATEQLENGKTAFVNRDSFIRDMRRIAVEDGIQTTGPDGRGTIRDIRSVKRLGMIYDIQTESATGYARFLTDMDPDVLDEFPAYRLGPSTARQPRSESEWRARWSEAGSSIGWQGASRVDMVALKTSPIWSTLSVFNTPWPPFDFGSSRMLEDVDRDEAAGLGIIARTGQVPEFGADGNMPHAFNERLEASVQSVPPGLLDWLLEAFGNQVAIQGSRLVWTSA